MESQLSYLQQQRYNYGLQQQLQLLRPLAAGYSRFLDPFAIAQLSLTKGHPYSAAYLGGLGIFVSNGDSSNYDLQTRTRSSSEMSPKSDNLSDRPTDQGGYNL